MAARGRRELGFLGGLLRGVTSAAPGIAAALRDERREAERVRRDAGEAEATKASRVLALLGTVSKAHPQAQDAVTAAQLDVLVNGATLGTESRPEAAPVFGGPEATGPIAYRPRQYSVRELAQGPTAEELGRQREREKAGADSIRDILLDTAGEYENRLGFLPLLDEFNRTGKLPFTEYSEPPRDPSGAMNLDLMEPPRRVRELAIPPEAGRRKADVEAERRAAEKAAERKALRPTAPQETQPANLGAVPTTAPDSKATKTETRDSVVDPGIMPPQGGKGAGAGSGDASGMGALAQEHQVVVEGRPRTVRIGDLVEALKAADPTLSHPDAVSRARAWIRTRRAPPALR